MIIKTMKLIVIIILIFILGSLPPNTDNQILPSISRTYNMS